LRAGGSAVPDRRCAGSGDAVDLPTARDLGGEGRLTVLLRRFDGRPDGCASYRPACSPVAVQLIGDSNRDRENAGSRFSGTGWPGVGSAAQTSNPPPSTTRLMPVT